MLVRARRGDHQGFDPLVAPYAQLEAAHGGWLTDWVLGQLDAPPAGRTDAPPSLVDLGCGTGRLSRLLAERGYQVRALDLSPGMIAFARAQQAHPRVAFEVADLTSVTGSYDVVLSVLVLHHVIELAAVLDRLRGLVRPGGLALVVDLARPAPVRRPQVHGAHLRFLAQELTQRRPGAWTRFRARSQRAWVSHLCADRPLTPAGFRAEYGRAFPGATIEVVGGLHTMRWQAPPPGRTPPGRAVLAAGV